MHKTFNWLLTVLLISAIVLNVVAFMRIKTHPHYGPYMEASIGHTSMDKLWFAICEVESGGDPNAVNRPEKAFGVAQIRPIMVDDVNRILGEDRYDHADAFNPFLSREMFDVYVGHYFPDGDAETIARGWNGGPRGPKKSATRPYWEKVQEHLR